MFLCQLVSLLQEQITINLVDWASHSKWVCYNDNSFDSATNRLLFISSTTYLYSQNWRTTARWYVLRTEWNIYYMSETTKIWAEIRSSLNIWSWIKRACLNDKNSEPATKAWTKQALLHACSRDESTVSLLQRRVRYWSRHRVSHSIVSLLQWHGQNRPLRWASRLVSLLQWSFFPSHSESATKDRHSISLFLHSESTTIGIFDGLKDQ